jgi:hypothetical protein
VRGAYLTSSEKFSGAGPQFSVRLLSPLLPAPPAMLLEFEETFSTPGIVLSQVKKRE